MNPLSPDFIRVARGDKAVDLVLKNARLVNVFSGEIYQTDVAIYQSRIVGFGSYQAKRTFDLKGLYLSPGFIDGHIHIESTMLTPSEFARSVLPRGTTTVVCDPHEIANVLGVAGIKYFLTANRLTPLAIYVMLPSCVPATTLESSGAHLGPSDLGRLKDHPAVLGLAEVMNYPAVLAGTREILAKIRLVSSRVIDGHSPGLMGKPLYGYLAAGISSDHETTTVPEALEKLRSGMFLMLRQGSTAKNLSCLLGALRRTGWSTARRCFLVSDDRHPGDLVQEGHLDHILKDTIRLGVPPVVALQMVTLNPAEYFGLRHLGRIAPGAQADLVAFSGWADLKVRFVWKAGQLVAREGEVLKGLIRPAVLPLRNTIRIKPLHPESLRIPATGRRVLVIKLVPDQIITRKVIYPARIENGQFLPDTGRDIAKIAVVERHRASGRIGLGFVQGFGLQKGALASSVAHDAHNLIVVGTNDEDMLIALKKVTSMKGGYAVASGGKIRAALALPVAGLLSPRPARVVAADLNRLHQTLRTLGSKLPHPLMILSFLALAPVPELKITDHGLVDAVRFRIIPLSPRRSVSRY